MGITDDDNAFSLKIVCDGDDNVLVRIENALEREFSKAVFGEDDEVCTYKVKIIADEA